MALDFHRLDNQEFLFGLDDNKCANLEEIFSEYTIWVGNLINRYNDTKLTIENQRTIVKIIDNYIDKSNLNLDKQKTKDILEFRTFLNYYSKKSLEIKLIGD